MKEIDLTCNEQRYAEFPELKYGTFENQQYIDITQYLIDKGLTDTHSIHKFQIEYGAQIIKANRAYEIPPDSTVAINKENKHFLLAGELGLMFLMYTDPAFLVYILERMDEMLIQGFVLSDTQLHIGYHERFSSPLAS